VSIKYAVKEDMIKVIIKIGLVVYLELNSVNKRIRAEINNIATEQM
jgi:hypothetical protein